MEMEEIFHVGDPLLEALKEDIGCWDPRLEVDNERLMSTEDLKEVRIGPSSHKVIKIDTSLTEE